VEQQKESRVELYGKIQKMMDEPRKVYPWLTEAQVKGRAKRSKSINRRVLVDVTNPHATTTDKVRTGLGSEPSRASTSSKSTKRTKT
jgi:hypothetical protein